MAYVHFMLQAMRLDRAGSVAAAQAVAQIRAFDLRDRPAKLCPGNHVKYDSAGRRADAALMIVQWLDGQIVITFPPSMQIAPATWPKA